MADPQAFVVVGLGFGDEGKGSCVDHLVRKHKARAVVRFNGGHQASHAVVLPDGRSHRFSQFGSGTLAGVGTVLSKHVVIQPTALEAEAEHLRQIGVRDPYASLAIHEDCLVTTPFHRHANRLRELARGDARHGSCGVGFGETVELAKKGLAICAEDLLGARGKPWETMMAIHDHYQAEFGDEWAKQFCRWGSGDLANRFCEDSFRILKKVAIVDDSYIPRLFTDCGGGTVIFEGAQGVLLDQDIGFQPHTTWSKTTLFNVTELIPLEVRREVIGVTRSYQTRHGAGPLPSYRSESADPHNPRNDWQGELREGPIDLVLLRYAAGRCFPDSLAITWMDSRVQASTRRACVGYIGGHPPEPMSQSTFEVVQELPYPESEHESFELGAYLGRVQPLMADFSQVEWLDAVSDAAGVPIKLTSTGPTFLDKQECCWE